MEPSDKGAAAARRARLRKSDPTPSCSLATEPSPGPGRPKVAPSPLRTRFTGGWEFPLTREEKKQRVMWLFEEELVSAQKQNERSISALVGENEALHAQLDGREDAETDSPDGHTAEEAAEATESELPCLEEEEDETPAAAAPPARRGFGCMMALAALSVVAIVGIGMAAAMAENKPQPVTSRPRSVSTNATGSGRASANASANLSAAAQVLPPNTTAIVQRMRDHGLAKLGVSDCWKAEWYFASALELLEGLNTSSVAASERKNLLGDRGFALVCSQRFNEAVNLLEERLSTEGLKSPPHLLNALGYAKFRLRDYKKASEIFEAGTKADPMNPILWNNLAAAKMVSGDLRAADDALYYAVDRADSFKSDQHFNVEDYHRLIFMSNAENLWTRSQNQKSSHGLPQIELWRPEAK